MLGYGIRNNEQVRPEFNRCLCRRNPSMARNQAQFTQPNKPKNVKRDPVASGERDACVNRAASHDFFLLERYESGIALRGTEVKSIRAGQANLKDSYGLDKERRAFPPQRPHRRLRSRRAVQS